MFTAIYDCTFGPKLTVGARIVSVSDKPSRSETRLLDRKLLGVTGADVGVGSTERETDRLYGFTFKHLSIWSCTSYSQSSRSNKDISCVSFLLSFLDCLGGCFDTGV